jgi:hypothetical protein
MCAKIANVGCPWSSPQPWTTETTDHVRGHRRTDLAAVHAAFQETRWFARHIVRTIATIAAFGCLTWALLHGQTAGAAHTAPGPSASAAEDHR